LETQLLEILFGSQLHETGKPIWLHKHCRRQMKPLRQRVDLPNVELAFAVEKF
jgi:hypothetical protein